MRSDSDPGECSRARAERISPASPHLPLHNADRLIRGRHACRHSQAPAGDHGAGGGKACGCGTATASIVRARQSVWSWPIDNDGYKEGFLRPMKLPW